MPLAVLTLSPWLALLLAVPVWSLGLWVVAHVRALRRFSVPAPVIGGLIVALSLLLGRTLGLGECRIETGTAHRVWTWLVTAEPDWVKAPVKGVHLPLLAAFFACVGLNASWRLVRGAGRQVLLFLGAAALLAVIQNGVGLGLASLLGVSPLLGLVCGSMSLTGGHATTLGFAAEFERAGLVGAQTFGLAAATFGLVAGAVLAGPLGSLLIRRNRLVPQREENNARWDPSVIGRGGPVSSETGSVLRTTMISLLLLAICLKGGAWISFLLQRTGLVLPVFVGTLMAGVMVRNVLDALRLSWFEPRTLEVFGSVALALFLVTTMMTLNLAELAYSAGPMLVILGAQCVITLAFAGWLTFRWVGRDFDGAVMAAGHCGFGLGSTATAVAAMKALTEAEGPAPRAFLVVPLVGGFLVDLVNAINLTAFITLVSS